MRTPCTRKALNVVPLRSQNPKIRPAGNGAEVKDTFGNTWWMFRYKR
jgi:hypothetical protein